MAHPVAALLLALIGVSHLQASTGFSALPPGRNPFARPGPPCGGRAWGAGRGPGLALAPRIRAEGRLSAGCPGLVAEAAGEEASFEPVVIGGGEAAGGFSVLPPGLWPHGSHPEQEKPGVRDVLIKPGFGWGEGAHPTTNMCLGFLLDHVRASEAPSVLDYGTGSGVLAIAARRLGAKRVVAVDKDDEILEHAHENAALNFGEEHSLEMVHGREVVTGTRGLYLSDGMSHTFDVVVANMLAPALVRLAPSITSAVREQMADGSGGGVLALSGMRREQVRDVLAAYEQQGVTFFEEQAREGAAPGAAWAEWVLLKGRRAQLSEEQAQARAKMLSDLAVE